jgi:hypothetical protein
VTEPHQAEGVFFILGSFNGFPHILVFSDIAEHLNNGLVGPAVQGTPQSGNAGGNGGIKINPGTSHQAHRRCRAILFMIGMQNPEHAQCVDDIIINLVGFNRRIEHHI